MRTSKVRIMIALVLMAILSLSNLFGMPVAGLSVILGITFFFVIKRIEKQPRQDGGLNVRHVGKDLKSPTIWFWIITPSLMNLFAFFLSKRYFPEFISHVLTRSSAILSFDNISTLVLQVVVLALGEEIAWRAFFQKRIKAFMPVAPALIISSVLFSLAHLSNGSPVIILYDLFFIFANSILYGIIFEKTNNAWISTIAHFSANLIALMLLQFVPI